MTRTPDIERLLRSGQRVGSRMFDVKRLDSPAGHARVAIVVPKFGFTAVERNTLKRRLRELTRQHVLSRAGAYDLLIRARKEAYGAPFDRLRDEINHIAAQLA